MPAEMSRNVLSLARFIIRGDLQTTRHGQEEPEIKPKRKRSQKAGGVPSAKRRRPTHGVQDEDVIGAADSEVVRQVQALVVEGEDGVAEENEHERPPWHRISTNIVQTARGQARGSSATAKGRSVVRGRD
jgi:hypothetical protein